MIPLLEQALGHAVTAAFKQLLSEKHLYQYSEVNLAGFTLAGKTILEDWENEQPGLRSPIVGSIPKNAIETEKANTLKCFWVPMQVTSSSVVISATLGYISFELPTINTQCGFCDAVWPFNPIDQGSYFVQGEGREDFYYLGYQCQQCKGQPIRFLIRREGFRLRLAGRYPLEVFPTPKFFPKSVIKYYGDAAILHHAGQTLAGLFLLRVFIEQFWRTVPEVAEVVAANPRATGDVQGDAYNKTLPPEFHARFPSLKQIYGKLSEAIHLAKADAMLFEESYAKIEEHFDARRIFKIK